MTDSGSDDRPRGVLSAADVPVEAADGVDPRDVLHRVASLDVYAWRRRAGGSSGVEHLGPTAEFYDTFDVHGGGDRVPAGDADGVALAAIQGLVDRLEDQGERIERQRRVIDDQRADIETLRERVESLQSSLAAVRREREG